MSSALAFAAPPYYANVEATDQQVIRVTSPFVAGRLLVNVPGAYLYYPTLVELDVTTSAVVGNREALYIMFDSDGNVIGRQPVATVQPAGISYVYVWNITTGTSYFDGVANVAAPLPTRLMESGSSFGIQVNSLQAGDTGTMVVNVLRVPTGGIEGRRAIEQQTITTPLLT